MRLSDADLRSLCVQRPYDPQDSEVWRELIRRTRWAILRKLPNPEGTCAHGLRVYADQQGAYSSGYICHKDHMDHTLCNNGMGQNVIWDEDRPLTFTATSPPKRRRLLTLLETLPKV